MALENNGRFEYKKNKSLVFYGDIYAKVSLNKKNTIYDWISKLSHCA